MRIASLQTIAARDSFFVPSLCVNGFLRAADLSESSDAAVSLFACIVYKALMRK